MVMTKQKLGKITISPATLNEGNEKSFPTVDPIKIRKVWNF
jgi:hypothetical protein